MKKYRPKIHPNACRKLVRFFRQVKRETGQWNIRETARRLDVNQKYVQENLIHGIEPTDATESGRAVRVKIFLKAYKPKPRKPKAPDLRPEWLKRVIKAKRELTRETADSVVRRKPSQRNYLAVIRRREP